MYDKNKGFYKLDQYVDESYMDLSTQTGEYQIGYPLNFLKDALGGMTKSELLVIGADSGVGKSEAVNNIAFHNAKEGKKVYIFSLEGDKYDLINRHRYSCFLEELARRHQGGLACSYREFLINKIPEKGKDLLQAIDEEIKNNLKTLKVYNRKEDLSLALFESHLDLINAEADLVIIDHLHYFDFHKKEYEAINEIMKRIKKIQEKYRIPMILVSHLRKKDAMRSFPDQADFHGSSNIVKQADTCVVMAHIDVGEDGDAQQIKTNTYQTGIRIVKSRTGFSQKIIGVMDYDLEARKYSDEYTLKVCGNNYIANINEPPAWAKHARSEKQTEEKNADSMY